MDVASIPSKEELNQLLKKTFTSTFRSNYINVDGFTLPERYREFEETIKNFELFDDDVWITGFPKTGTTWISEIAWLILHDFDYEGAKEEDYLRTRMMEITMLFDPEKGKLFGDTAAEIEEDSFKCSKNQKRPRTLKSHLPFPLLPDQFRNGTKKPRVIYTARNPMDTCISYYHHCRNYEGFTGTQEDFSNLFLFDQINYGPYHKHVLSFWEQKKNPNILFLTYEEIKRDTIGVIRRVAKHLGKNITDEEIQKLNEYVSFESMKNNPAVNKDAVIKHVQQTSNYELTPFLRSGKIGGYRDTLSQELIEKFQYWFRKRFEGSGLNLLDN